MRFDPSKAHAFPGHGTPFRVPNHLLTKQTSNLLANSQLLHMEVRGLEPLTSSLQS